MITNCPFCFSELFVNNHKSTNHEMLTCDNCDFQYGLELFIPPFKSSNDTYYFTINNINYILLKDSKSSRLFVGEAGAYKFLTKLPNDFKLSKDSIINLINTYSAFL